MSECPFTTGDLVFSRSFQPLLKDHSWRQDDIDSWYELMYHVAHYEESPSPSLNILNTNTPCIIAEQIYSTDRWMAFVVSPKGKGWVEAASLRK